MVKNRETIEETYMPVAGVRKQKDSFFHPDVRGVDGEKVDLEADGQGKEV